MQPLTTAVEAPPQEAATHHRRTRKRVDVFRGATEHGFTTPVIVEQRGQNWAARSYVFGLEDYSTSPAGAVEALLPWVHDAYVGEIEHGRLDGSSRATSARLALTSLLPSLAVALHLATYEVIVDVPEAGSIAEWQDAGESQGFAERNALLAGYEPTAKELGF